MTSQGCLLTLALAFLWCDSVLSVAWAQGGPTLQTQGGPHDSPPHFCNGGIRHRKNAGSEDHRFVPVGDRLRFRENDGNWGEIRPNADETWKVVKKHGNIMLTDDPMLFLASETYGTEYYFDVCLPKQPGQGGTDYAMELMSTDALLGSNAYLQISRMEVEVKAVDGFCKSLTGEGRGPFPGEMRKISWTLDRSKTCVMRFIFVETSNAPRSNPHERARLMLKLRVPERLAQEQENDDAGL